MDNNNELYHYGILGMKWGRRKAKKKTVKDMSDDEIKQAISRLELERRYKDLNPQQVSKGKQFVNDFLNKSIIPAVTDASKTLAKDYLTTIGKKKLGLDVKDTEQAYIDKLTKEVEKMRLEKKYKTLKKELGE